MTTKHERYYVPAQSYWPIVGAVGLFFLMIGLANLIHVFQPGFDTSLSKSLVFLGIGVATIIFMVSGWFNHVIKESHAGLYSAQMDNSFRQGMIWFIFSEVMFFAAFFGALFYIRMYALPWLGGEGSKPLTADLLWPGFVAEWPLLNNPSPEYSSPEQAMPWQGLPLINTIILLTSGATVTWAHWALKVGKRLQLNIGLFLTAALGLTFISLQAFEYYEAYVHMGLTLDSGVYGSTFFMLTGFHGLHVTLGSIMLIVIFFRCLKGHFTKEHHFAFEATAWYWHFVDVVWLGLFIFVYIL